MYGVQNTTGKFKILLKRENLINIFLPNFRDHPSTIKKRFFSVTIVMLISPIFVYLFSADKILENVSLFDALGFRIKGLLTAFVLPLILTAILFLGPLSQQAFNGVFKTIENPFQNFTNVLWLRNHIVAPLSEEFTFRACMLPLLLQTFKPSTAVLITPLFFGVAHFHHMAERLRAGMDKKTVIIVSCKIFFSFYNGFVIEINFFCRFSIYLHDNIRNVFGLFICKNWSFCCTIHCTCIL